MAKKNNKRNRPITGHMTDEQRQNFLRVCGFIASSFGAYMLKEGGCHVDFKINGEDIEDIEKLHNLNITERIALAVKEERYEDAAKLKKLLEQKINKMNQQKSDNENG